MDKNSVIGFILIGIIIFGFTWYQSKQYKKQEEIRMQQDSIAMVETRAAFVRDSIAKAEAVAQGLDTTVVVETVKAPIYKDSLLEAASHGTKDTIVVLQNDKVEIALSTRGAMPYSARVKNYTNYDGSDLYIIKPQAGHLSVNIYAGENISTKDFVFDLVSADDSSAVMRLPFAGGGYIEQKFVLTDGYMVNNYLSFVGMDNVIPRNVSIFDVDFGITVPRMEKGYKNEKQYSKMCYYFSDSKKPEELGKGGRDAEKRVDAKVKWFAFQQQFFSAIMTAGDQFTSGEFSVKFFKEDDPGRNLMACTARVRSEFTHGNYVTVPYSFYLGPNHFQTLKSYDQNYEKIIPLGGSLVGWISRLIIIPCFNWLHSSIASFGIIILLMTIMLKIVISPLTIKSYKSSAVMNVLKPEIDKINEKYPKQEDAMKKQQATMDLYKRAGVSPAGGCLPMLLQFPVLWAMFRFFPASIELRQQPFLWAEDLSSYDAILSFNTRIPLLGDHLSLFALLMAVTMFFYSKMTSKQMSNDPSMAGMKFMSVWMMPIMMFFICNNLSSGLSYYYLLSNIFTMLQTWAIKKWFIDDKKILARVAANAGKPVKKSKWQLRLEEAQKMQQQQMKNRK